MTDGKLPVPKAGTGTAGDKNAREGVSAFGKAAERKAAAGDGSRSGPDQAVCEGQGRASPSADQARDPGRGGRDAARGAAGAEATHGSVLPDYALRARLQLGQEDRRHLPEPLRRSEI